MSKLNLKEYLRKLADQVTDETTLEDIYDQLALLADIDKSEYQVEKGETISQSIVEEQSKKRLK
jgi:hypothetical protein